jgi:hypothetical protein
MSRWEQLEEWLFDNDLERFNSRDLAASLGVTSKQASTLIRAYLAAQRGAKASTLYVLKREGRTSRAVWSVGQRTADARVIGGTLFEDVSVKVQRAFAPDLERLAARNPRAARYCEAKIEAVLDGALKVLAVSVDGMID